jgi:hypothetical protein
MTNTKLPDTQLVKDNSRPTNHNLLTTNYFRMVISRAPGFGYFVKSTSLPDISMPELTQATSLSTNIPLPGNAYQFSPLQVEFLLDENLRGWGEIYDWIYNIGNYESHGNMISYVNRFSDITLQITNSAYVPQFEIVFKNAFPVALSSIPFTIAQTDNVPLTATATFKYAYFKFNALTSV